ncbi:MAG: serine acetyltransferase [Phycisphaerales bacterium]|nr:serine acetyltransferase [Phycisphaerales bacterium]
MTAPRREATGPSRDLPVDEHALHDHIERLAASIKGDPRTYRARARFLPDRAEIAAVLERLDWLMFPGFFGSREVAAAGLEDHVAEVMRELVPRLFDQLSAALRYEREPNADDDRFAQLCEASDRRASQVLGSFLSRLPGIRRLLSLDVQAAFDGDPAARHTDEIIFCYPGIRAMTVHRIAHELYRLEVPLLPRMMSELAHARTGIDIHPGATIGKSFFIDHGTGVVIGETTNIGDHCRIYQGVTLGAAFFEKDEQGRMKRGAKRHPTLEDHVTVYASATILGGTTVIGAGSQINGGVFLTSSVPPGHVVRAPRFDLTLRNNPDMPPASFSI